MAGARDVTELAFRSFIRTFGLLRNNMEPYFARFGISATQWGVLRTLHRAAGEGLEGLRLRELGERIWVRPPSVTSLIDRLERSGLVTRHAETGDQRAKQVKLTLAGRQLVTRVLRHHPAQMHNMMSGLTPVEQRELHRLLERLAAHLAAPARSGTRNAAWPQPVEEDQR